MIVLQYLNWMSFNWKYASNLQQNQVNVELILHLRVIICNFKCLVNRNGESNLLRHAIDFINRNEIVCNICIKLNILAKLYKMVPAFNHIFINFLFRTGTMGEPQSISNTLIYFVALLIVFGSAWMHLPHSSLSVGKLNTVNFSSRPE